MKRLHLVLLVVPALAGAAEVQLRSTTLVTGAPTLASGPNQAQSLVPIYELVGLRADRLELAGFDAASLTVDGWGSVLPGGPTVAGDVNLAYFEGLKGPVRARLGRQLIVGGSARMMALDGLFVEVHAPLGFGVSAFAGQPVARRFSNFTRGDLGLGARLFWAPSTDAQLGVSFTHVADAGIPVRQDLGVDGRWFLSRAVTLSGALLFSVAEARLAELDLGPRWQPFPELELSADYRRTAPDLFLPRNSIFTVFADTTRDALGGTASYQLSRVFSLAADGHAVWLNSQAGYDLGFRAQARPLRSNATSLTAQARRLAIPENGYTQGRLAARHTLPSGFGLFVDLDLYRLDTAVRAQRYSFLASAGLSYTLERHWLVGLSLLEGTTPFYERRTEVMAKLSYVFPEGAL